MEVDGNAFSYLHFVDLNAGEQYKSFLSLAQEWLIIIRHLYKIHRKIKSKKIVECNIPDMLQFTSYTKPFLGHSDVKLNCMAETMSHRLIRTKHSPSFKLVEEIDVTTDLAKRLVPEIPHVPRPPTILKCQEVS